jgi:IPT/TIG domain-containing protein/ZU5 domain-containing protein
MLLQVGDANVALVSREAPMKGRHIKLFRVTVLLLAILTSMSDLFAQRQTLYLPVLQATHAGDVGLALSNPALSDATVTLTARGLDGQVISGPEITNPVTLVIPASGQRSLRAGEIFGAGVSGKTGWVELAASTPAVKGFFILFDAGLNFIDGAELASTPSPRLIFPRVSATRDSATDITFINTKSSGLRATVALYDNAGNLTARNIIVLDPFSGFSGPITRLVPVDGGFEGYAVVDAGSTPFARHEPLVGFETYKNRSDIALLLAVPESAMLRTGFLVQLASQSGYQTRLTLVNYSAEAQVVNITADSLNRGGHPRTPSSVIVERTIPPNGRLEEGAEQMFGLSGNELIVGSVRFDVQGSTRGLIGYLDYGTTDGILLSAVPAQGTGFSDLYFSHIAEGLGFYTGMALLNPNTQSCSVTIDVFNREGRRVDSAMLVLAPGERRSRLVSQLLPVAADQVGGFVHVTASQPIFANQVFGSRLGLTFLANVSAQGVLLRPQASGRTVIATTGAEVIATDVSASMAIPPGALPEDTSIRLSSVAISSLPDPSPTQKIVAAIDTGPSGTRFNIPVKLTFPLSVQLAAGGRLALLNFNSSNRHFEDSGSAAVVDESGRMASADISHFSTYAVALPADQLVSVTDVSPSTGIPGTIVSISGSGFSTDGSQNNITFAGKDNISIKAAVISATATLLTVTIPEGAVTGDLIVQVGSRSSIGVTFRVPVGTSKPGITAISPTNVTPGMAPVEIQISGSGFRTDSTVTYDGANITPSFVDSTLLLITVSGARLDPAVHKIIVSNPAPGGGNSNTAEFTVGFPAPVLSSLSPASISKGSTSEITISGSGFTPSTSVLVNGTAASAIFVNKTTMTITVVASDIVTRLISVSNPVPGGGISNTLALTITSQPSLTLSSVIPSSGVKGTSVAVTLTGTNFSSGASVAVSGTGVTVGSVNVVGAVSITTTFNIDAGAAAGEHCVTVTTPAGTSPCAAFNVLDVTSTAVAVQVTSSTAVGAYDITIGFDKNVVNCNSDNVTGGNSAGFTGRPTSVNCRNAEGTLRLNHFQSGNSPTGTFTVANVFFIPVGAGTSNLTVTVNALTDTAGLANLAIPPAQVILSPGSITVTHP